MTDGLDELQKAVDNRPYLENYPNIQSFMNHLDLWHNDLKRLFSALQKGTFFAKERSLRKMISSLERKENHYEESKDDYGLHDEMISHLNGRIAESRAIRIQLEKLLEGKVVSSEGVSERSSVEGQK